MLDDFEKLNDLFGGEALKPKPEEQPEKADEVSETLVPDAEPATPENQAENEQELAREPETDEASDQQTSDETESAQITGEDDCDSAGLFLGRLIDFIVTHGLRVALLRKGHRDRGSQCRQIGRASCRERV